MSAEEQGSQVQSKVSEKDFHQTPRVVVPSRERMLHWRTCEGEKVEGTLCVKKGKEKRNSQGKDPRTY